MNRSMLLGVITMHFRCCLKCFVADGGLKIFTCIMSILAVFSEA